MSEKLHKARIAVSDARRDLIDAQERRSVAIAAGLPAEPSPAPLEARLAAAEAALQSATAQPLAVRLWSSLVGRRGA